MKLETITDNRFGIVSSHRRDRTQAENKHLFSQLRALVDSLNLSYTTGTGKWRDAPEPAIMVRNIGLDELREIGSKYGQEAVAYCGPETDNKLEVIRIASSGSQ